MGVQAVLWPWAGVEAEVVKGAVVATWALAVVVGAVARVVAEVLTWAGVEVVAGAGAEPVSLTLAGPWTWSVAVLVPAVEVEMAPLVEGQAVWRLGCPWVEGRRTPGK